MRRSRGPFTPLGVQNGQRKRGHRFCFPMGGRTSRCSVDGSAWSRSQPRCCCRVFGSRV